MSSKTSHKYPAVISFLMFIVSATMVHGQELEDFTYRLTASTGSYQFWTTPPAERVFKDDAVPADTATPVKVYAAKNEFEPFQVVVKPAASGTVTVSAPDFGAGIDTEIYQVKYVPVATPTDYFGRTGDNPDPLWPLPDGATVGITAGENTAFWFNVYVSQTASAGDYSGTVIIGGVAIPVTLHVFDFAIPEQLHIKSQMNLDHNAILTKYGVSAYGSDYWTYVDRMKQFMIDHRLTPKSVLWPGGLTSTGGGPLIDYDCAGTLADSYGIWGFEAPAERYLNGTGLMENTFTESFNGGTGFPSFMAATFQNNDASADQRPSTFCGQTRSASDWYTANNPNSPYNQEWFEYIAGVRSYLSGLGYLDKAYYYFANEPQDQADYDAVAWYSQELKKVASDLKLMISEEPKPEIYAHPTYTGVKIDTWLAHFGPQLNPAVSWDRMEHHDEETWIYFLNGTFLPRFNPVTIDHPGIEGKLTGWFLWKYRLRGIAYYSFNNWSVNPWSNPLASGQNGNLFLMYPPSQDNADIAYGSNGHRFVPSIRLEMVRDGLEDYEYLYLLNASASPQPNQENPADVHVGKVIGDLVAYSRDSNFIYNLRRVVGQKLGGEISVIPDIAPASTHERSDGFPGNYYINFQDPSGDPIDDPLLVNGHTYMKIGDALYDPAAGYGWIKAAEVPDSDFFTAWDQWVDTEPQALLGSAVIDSWGRQQVFEFDLPNGTYNVTACAGSRSSPRYQSVAIEGVVFMDDERTDNSWITRTKTVTVRDKKLTMVMGKYERIGYINYLDIEAAEVMGDVNQDGNIDLSDAIIALQIQSNLVPAQFFTSADVDGDGSIGTQEALFVLQKLGSFR